MFKLDNDFLQSLGLGGLPVEEKNKLLQMIYERLEMNVGMRLAEKMSDQQLDEFEGFIDRNDEAGALKWLESNFPNYKDVVAEELEKLKVEVQTAAPQILAAHTNAQMPPIAQAPIMPGMPPAPTDASQQQPQGYAPQPAMPQQGFNTSQQPQFGQQPMQPQQPAQQPSFQPAYPQFDTPQPQPAPSFQQPAQPQFPPTGGGQGFDPSGPQPMQTSAPQPQFGQPAPQQPQPMPAYQAPAPQPTFTAPTVDQSQPAPQPIQPQQPAQPPQDGQFTPPPAGFTPSQDL